MKSTIWSVALYGAETWTMTADHRNKLEAFEITVTVTTSDFKCLLHIERRHLDIGGNL